jgi:glycosyltransferase involved in cell wall biosynthesis
MRTEAPTRELQQLDVEQLMPTLPTSRYAPVHVLLVTEGTYPCYPGGVSNWCDLLVRGTPEVDFTLLSLTGSLHPELTFSLPSNVRACHRIPLWGTRDALEARDDLSFRDIHERKARTNDSAIAKHFLPAFAGFLHSIINTHPSAGSASSGGPRLARSDQRAPRGLDGMLRGSDIKALRNPNILSHLLRMHGFFLEHDFDTCLRSRLVWECFVETSQHGFPAAAKESGYPGARLRLADLTDAMGLLQRWLIPISVPLPKADVMHATGGGLSALTAAVAAQQHGAGFLLTEHGLYLRERYLAEAEFPSPFFVKLFSLRFIQAVTELAYAMADQISPGSNHNQRWELKSGASPARLRTIYNGVDPATVQPAPKPDSTPRVVWVGRITPIKDLFTLLRAAAIVCRARPEVEFCLYGTAAAGEKGYERACLALRAELGLESSVRFPGHAPTVEGAFNTGDIVVLSSISEGFPYAVVEAMLCARPVVATAVGGVPEAVEGCGLTVEPRNPEQMAAALLELLADPDRAKALGIAGRERAARDFNLEQCKVAYLEAYERLAEAPLEPVPVAVAPGHDTSSLPAPEPKAAAVALAALLEELAVRLQAPVDALEVAALLESIAITDEVAATRYGAPDTFALADTVMSLARARGVGSEPQPAQAQPEASWRQVMRDYARGPTSMLPVVVLLLIVEAYRRLGHWSEADLLVFISAVSASLVVTNGFVQAASRRGAIYLSRGLIRTAQAFLLRVMTAGALCVAAVALGTFVVSNAFGLMSPAQELIFVLTFIALGSIWLIAGVLAIVEAPAAVGLGLGAGLATAVVVDQTVARFSPNPITAATLAGLAVTMAILLRAVRRALGRIAGSQAAVPKLAPVGYLVHEAAPYFGYGLLYMVFVLLPHALGWLAAALRGTTQSNDFAALEVGMTIALLPIIVASGVPEHAAREFWSRARAGLISAYGESRWMFAHTLGRFYRQHLAYYLLALAGVSLVVVLTFQVLLQAHVLGHWLRISDVGRAQHVFWVGLGGYGLLGCGLFNCLFIVTLGRAGRAIRAVAVGMAVSLAVGLPLALAFDPSFAVAGFLAGSAAFLVTTSWETAIFLRAADYYFYAAN